MNAGAVGGDHAAAQPIVVKLGGSLADQQALPALLSALCVAAAQGQRIVIVPGGGPFADAVRAAQAAAGFDDATAHHMALLAMAQYGLMLVAVSPQKLHLARGAVAIETAPAPVVWLPDPWQDAREAERSWRVTSDTLALWLAARLGARRVVLVKTCVAPAQSDLAALAAGGIVDAAYPTYAAARPEVSTALVFGADPQALRATLAASN